MTERLRWSNHYLCPPPDFGQFWREYAETSQRTCLLVAGRGFDPRTLEVPTALVRAGVAVAATRLVHLVDQYNPTHPESQSRAASDNEEELRTLLESSDFEVTKVVTRTQDGRVTGGQQISNISAGFDPSHYTDVIVDITALPTSIYFPLLGTLLKIHDQTHASWNLHCVVCENAVIDDAIHPEGGDQAELMYGFSGSFRQVGREEHVTVWAPVLGENQAETLGKISDMVGARDIKPVLPFPSKDPRRGDNLVAEYAAQIFDDWSVGTSGLIYAHEQDPFDLYAQLSGLKTEYSRALKLAGPVQVVVSTHASKLLSLGVLLAAYEHELAVMHVEPAGYEDEALSEDAPGTNELFEVWLAGEPYLGENAANGFTSP